MLIKNEYKPQMAQKKSKMPQTITTNGRLYALLLVIGVAFLGLVTYSLFVQMHNREKLEKLSDDRVLRSIKENVLRGTITDRNGRILAASRHLKIVSFNPRAIYEPRKAGQAINWNMISDEQFAQLAKILELPISEVKSRLQDITSGHQRFPTKLTLEQVDQIKALKIPTAHFEDNAERTYPTGRLFSHIIGFTNMESGVEKGIEGIELSQNSRLIGENGTIIVKRDVHQNIVEVVDSPKNKAAKSGDTVVLSVDYELQRLAHQELEKAVKQYRAASGGVVVLDAKTGEILAMSSLPDYDANNYGEAKAEDRRNSAVGVTFEPGSIIKPFIVAKALDEGKISRNQMFNTQPYFIKEVKISDPHSYSSLTTEGILQKSSNVGVSKISLNNFTPQALYDYYRSIGFGQKTNSGVTGEQYQQVRAADKWSKVDQATMAYGYGIAANLLQMAQGYTIFTTDGHLMPATIYKREQAVAGKRILKPETARQMREMLLKVTQKGGTGTSAAIDGIDVAGKTGTAKKVLSGRKGYGDLYRASFVGFAPAKNPRLIVAVTIDEPHGGYYGGVVAAPVFRNVMKGSLEILGLKPHSEDSVSTTNRK